MSREDWRDPRPDEIEEWRDPRPDELRVLRRLLSVHFPGCEAYRSQLIGLKVARDTGDGSWLFMLPDEKSRSATPTERWDLTYGVYHDLDGIKVELHLVARHGRLRFLDWMKLDPARPPLAMFPRDDRIVVRVSPSPLPIPKPDAKR